MKRALIVLVLIGIKAFTVVGGINYSSEEPVVLNKINQEERIEALEKTNADLVKQQQDNKRLYEIYEVLLRQYENSRSSLIAEFTILIAVLTLIFGLVGYFGAYKPAQDSKKEVDRLLESLQTNIDVVFSEYLRKNRDRMIDNYIQILEENRESDVSNAIHYLDLVKHEGFNPEQLFKMRRLVLNIESRFGNQIFTYMNFSKSEIVENTCVEVLQRELHNISVFALIYFAKHEIHNHDALVVNYLNKNPDKWGSMIASIRNASEDYLIKLLEDYNKALNSSSVEKIAGTLRFYADSKLHKDPSKISFLEKIKSTGFVKNNSMEGLQFLNEQIEL